MHPVRLSIEGVFEDGYLYGGVLYLITQDQELWLFDWDAFVEDFISRIPHLRWILKWSFLRNHFLSTEQFKDIWDTCDAWQSLWPALQEASEKQFAFAFDELELFAVCRMALTTELINDITIYNFVLYFADECGTYESLLVQENRRLRLPLKPEKLHDVPTFGLSAKYRLLNTSCAEDGLFSLSTFSENRLEQPHPWRYHFEKFSLGSVWIGSDFISYGSGEEFDYLMNVRSTYRKQVAEQADEEREAIEHIGERVLNIREIVRGRHQPKGVKSVFTGMYRVYVCDMEGQLLVYRRARRKDKFLQKGLEFERVVHDQIGTIYGGVTVHSMAILDTGEGTFVEDETGLYLLEGGSNALVRSFPAAKWYDRLVLSIKDDHLSMACLWPTPHSSNGLE